MFYISQLFFQCQRQLASKQYLCGWLYLAVLHEANHLKNKSLFLAISGGAGMGGGPPSYGFYAITYITFEILLYNK